MAIITDLEIAEMAYPTDWSMRDRFNREMADLMEQRVFFPPSHSMGNTTTAMPADIGKRILRETMSLIAASQKELGLNIVWSPYALNPTTIRLFPASKHRSGRIRKKLIKRHGGEFLMGPAIWETSAGIIAHPQFKAELLAAIEKKNEGLTLGALRGFTPWAGPAKGLGE